MMDAEIVAKANELARELYRIRGYSVPEGYRFDQAKHPHEVEAWQGAVITFDVLRNTSVDDALSNLEDDEE